MSYPPRDGRVIAGHPAHGKLHVREHGAPGDRWYRVCRAGYACGVVEVLCVTVCRERALAYWRRWRQHPWRVLADGEASSVDP